MKSLAIKNYKEKLKLSYDPDDVNVRLQHFRVFEVVSMIKGKGILNDDFNLLEEIKAYKKEKRNTQVDLFDEDELIETQGDDGLQRNTELWNNQQKSQFIESLMINLPIPLFYFDGSRKPWRIVDGLQRIFTIMNFIEEGFKLSGLEYLEKECNGLKFSAIPGYLRARILDAEIIAYVINPGTPPDVKYNIFKRINTGGLKLTGQEIRNAFFRGKPADFTKMLANQGVFKKATNNKITSRRMVDREYVNRFIAFHIFDYKTYNGKMDAFLSEAMMILFSYEDKDFDTLKSTFITSLERANTLLGDYAFYRPKLDNTYGRSPNKAIFDTLTWNLSLLSEKEFKQVLSKKDGFRRKYVDFMNKNDIMYKSVNDTTSSKPSVSNRFYLLNDFISKFTK
jgi:hypothetical protein